MLEDRLQMADLLRRIHLFQSLDGEQISQLASRLAPVRLDRGERLFAEGDPGDSLYFIFEGQVKVTRGRGEAEEQLAVLVAGDYFGEEAVLSGRPRSASISAVEPAVLLRMDHDLFVELVQTIPNFRANLVATAESHQLARRIHYEWLAPGEVIHLITRKHITVLWLGLVGPVVIGMFSLPFFYLAALTGTISPVIIGALILLAAGLWAVWRIVDWGNDYYVVTNQRVVWLERVVALYDSREEAPLRTVLSVSVGTDQLGRILGYGDVIVRTYTGRIVLRNVGRPQELASLVEQFWLRSRRRTQEEESEAMERTLRDHLGMPVREPPKPEPAKAPPQETDELEAGASGIFALLIAKFFKLRYEEGSVITYRKHWFLLLRRIWVPTGLFISMLVFMALLILGYPEFLSSLTVIVVGVSMLTLLIGWLLYEFIDWRNDIYQLTPDHILDIDRKPLGTEQKKSAPLENILSLEHERVGILGLVLNFGNVAARIGTAEFTFTGVHDPARVQQDIFQRMDERLRQKREAEAARERERMAEWLATYHRNFEEFRQIEGGADED